MDRWQTHVLLVAALATMGAASASGVSPESDIAPEFTALHRAIRDGRRQFAIELLNRGAPLDFRAEDGLTPLMMAAARGDADMTRILLARGARAAALSDDGRMALDFARPYPEIANMLRRAVETEGAPRPRPRRTPPRPPEAVRRQATLPPWSPDPLRLEVPRAANRLASLLARIDGEFSLRALPTPPPYRPIENWVGEKFVFLPSDPGHRHDYPSFETREDVSEYRFEPSYEALAGRIAAVVGVGHIGSDWYVDLRLDGEPVIVRGITRPTGELPEIAPLLDEALARRIFRGKMVIPRGLAVTRYHLPAGRPVRVVEVAPASKSQNPVRLLIETQEGTRITLDGGLSATNVPIKHGKREFDDLTSMLDVNTQ